MPITRSRTALWTAGLAVLLVLLSLLVASRAGAETRAACERRVGEYQSAVNSWLTSGTPLPERAPRPCPAPRADRGAPRATRRPGAAEPAPPREEAWTDSRTVSSTAYCLTGNTASGSPVRPGQAAMNGVPLGSRWRVSGGGTYTVTDRIGHGSGFDVAMPGDCAAARLYGRRTVTVTRVG